MSLRLYNTLTRSKEEFVPLDPTNVRMYVCGPTVYDYAHIGNARPVIVFDVLYRLLKHLYPGGGTASDGSRVTYVRNITDIDDKINARALERRGDRNVPVLDVLRELTEETQAQYLADVTALGNLPPTHTPRATEHVPEMIVMIAALIASGHAYAADGHVLFDVGSKPDYGKLSRRPLDEMIAGARVEVAPYKKNPMDFVLWKPSDENTPGWDSPWGRGRPGWHLECSAMSARYLGETFDIHGGGIDLLFPHHENEIAQSECAHHGHPLAKVWMHNGFLNVEGEKMSKSLGNFVTIHELLQDYAGAALRLAMLQTHYRQPINWSKSKVEDAWSELRDWTALIYGSHAEHDLQHRRVTNTPPKPHPSVLESLCDDLNTSDTVTALRDLYKSDDPNAYTALIESGQFLGLFAHQSIGAFGRGVGSTNLGPDRTFHLYGLAEELRVAILNGQMARRITIEKEIADQGVGVDISYDGHIRFHPLSQPSAFQGGTVQRLISQRNAARAAKNFKEADRIRDELLAQGIQLKDGPDGTTWEVKR